MIGRKYRFHGHNSLRYVYQHGRTVRNSLLAIRYVHNPRRTDFRVAVVVSKKVSKSAVVRNRIRRRLYEFVRTHAELIDGPYDIVMTVYNPELATLPAQTIEQSIQELIQQARDLSPHHRNRAHAKIEQKEQ